MGTAQPPCPRSRPPPPPPPPPADVGAARLADQKRSRDNHGGGKARRQKQEGGRWGEGGGTWQVSGDISTISPGRIRVSAPCRSSLLPPSLPPPPAPLPTVPSLLPLSSGVESRTRSGSRSYVRLTTICCDN